MRDEQSGQATQPKTVFRPSTLYAWPTRSGQCNEAPVYKGVWECRERGILAAYTENLPSPTVPSASTLCFFLHVASYLTITSWSPNEISTLILTGYAKQKDKCRKFLH